MDILLVETGNGGDALLKGKDLALCFGLDNMPYLALFGGSRAANTPTTRPANQQAFDWWGNNLLYPNNSSLQFNSFTERALHQIQLTSSGRQRIEDAIIKDLEFMLPFAEVRVKTQIIATDKIRIAIGIKRPDNLQEKEFIYIWDAMQQQLEAQNYYHNTPKQIEEALQYGLGFVL